jgi:hypothetical protein
MAAVERDPEGNVRARPMRRNRNRLADSLDGPPVVHDHKRPKPRVRAREWLG